ncbi:MAG: magnesium-dependent phosphatase-1 [Candidatus Jordarchaeum sp.]|uniref:magnesium-dependent phosphatase-1 n=1 Tax=Candidatus Jordarchaeum sp. TaxID=2823881 RepID=UPI004049224C
MIKLVIFDADETLWTIDRGFASLLTPPLKRTGLDTLVDAEGKKLRLFGGVRNLLNKLREKGILLSIASSNQYDPNMVEECLKILEIDFFTYPQINYRDKGQNVKNLLNLINENLGENINFENVIFVDDSRAHIFNVKTLCPGITVLHIGSDISEVTEILKYI